MKKTSTFQNGLIWFGAGVSLAEILTGTAFAPLGMAKGFAAILLGHIIGCAMMLLAGLIGGRTGRSAMETVKMSFGQKGGLLFAFLNVLQLVGWTAIMIYDGALAVGGIFAIGRWVWCLVIGALIIVWIAVGVTDLGWINKITMAALFILTLVLCKVIFFSGNAMVGIDGESLTFGAAVELAVAMPLSWLPLISDYTRDAEKPTQATWVPNHNSNVICLGFKYNMCKRIALWCFDDAEREITVPIEYNNAKIIYPSDTKITISYENNGLNVKIPAECTSVIIELI